MGIVYNLTKSVVLEVIADIIMWLSVMIILSLMFHKDIFGYLLIYGTLGLCLIGTVIIICKDSK